MTRVTVRPAAPGEAGLVHGFILELAAYERLSSEVKASALDIDQALFGHPPRAFCDIGSVDDVPVGFALFFYNFSTFQGRAGLYLEDLYVRAEARGLGVGRALLQGLARRCVEEGLGRLDWAVLNWNQPSIAFYDALGAEALEAWTTRRLSGAALNALAEL